MSNDQNRILGYVDCGKDDDGFQIVIYLPAVAEIEVQQSDDGELVYLTYLQGRTRELGPQHSKAFLLGVGMRQPESSNLYVPDTKQLGKIS